MHPSSAADAGSTTTSPGARLARTLAGNFERWTGLRLKLHVACVLVLALVPVVRWWPTVSETRQPLGDEVEYFAAFDHVVEGRSPFAEDDYLYPSVFAFAGAWSVEHLGRTGTDVLLRAINLLGLAVAIWCSMAWLPWSASRRLLAGVAFILVAPQVSYSVLFNNFSLAVAGMLLGGLLLASRSSLAAGLLLGGSVALKPIAPMAIGCLLFAHREVEERRLRWAAVVAIAAAAAFILPDPHLDELLALTGDTERVAASITLHRFPQLFGYQPNALWISVPLALAALAFVATRRLGRVRLLCFAVTASLAVTPLVWSHTLVALLPVEVLALTVAAHRWQTLRQRPRTSSPLPAWVEPVFVVLAVASIQLSSGAGSIGDRNVVLQLFGAGVPAISPLALLAYLLIMTEEF